VLTVAQMVGPRRLVDPLGQLAEARQVGGAQVQLALGSPEVEAPVGRQLPARILADVTAVGGPPAGDLEALRSRRRGAAVEENGFSGGKRAAAHPQWRVAL